MTTTRRTNGTSTPRKRDITDNSTSTTTSSTATRNLETPRRTPYLPTPLEATLLALYPVTLVLGSLFTYLSPTLSPPSNTSTYSHTHQAYHPASEAPSYFATKRNVFNVYFVKIGWFWVTLALAAFTLLAARGRAGVDSGVGHFLLGRGISNHSSDAAQKNSEGTKLTTSPRLQDLDPVTQRDERDARLRRRYQVLLRYALCTTLWFLTTQWFFGPPLVDRGFSLTGGACAPTSRTTISSAEAINEVHSSTHCKRVGGRWRGGWDVSGHVFILVLGSGMLWLEMLPVMLPWVLGVAGGRVVNVPAPEGALGEVRKVRVGESDEAPLLSASTAATPEASSDATPSHSYNTRRSPNTAPSQPLKFQTSQPHHARRSYATLLSLTVAILSWWMLLMTAAYFHTWSEKLGGLVLAAAGLWGVYFLPRGLRGVRGVVGMPGV